MVEQWDIWIAWHYNTNFNLGTCIHTHWDINVSGLSCCSRVILTFCYLLNAKFQKTINNRLHIRSKNTNSDVHNSVGYLTYIEWVNGRIGKILGISKLSTNPFLKYLILFRLKESIKSYEFEMYLGYSMLVWCSVYGWNRLLNYCLFVPSTVYPF